MTEKELKDKAYEAKQRKAWEDWYANALFGSYKDRHKIANDPTVYFPATKGYTYSVMVENESQLVDFILKFNNLDQWVEGGVISLVPSEHDEECYVERLTVTDPKTKESYTEVISCYPVPKKVEGYVFDYNPFFKRNERVQCSKRFIGAYRRDNIKVLVEPGYPCMVKYWCERDGRDGVLSITFTPITPFGVINVECS